MGAAGSDRIAFDNEKPQHRVHLDALRSSQPEHFLDGQLGFRCAASPSQP
jgi:hypothetical protein